MSLDLRLVRQHVSQFYGSQPHPQAPDVTVAEYPVYERVAQMLNSEVLRGNKPEPDQVVHAHLTLKGADLSPAEFEHLWTISRPIANRLLDRDPSIMELAQNKGKLPGEIHHYYDQHPYPGYEEVSAGKVAQYWRAAEPIARFHGRTPNIEEVSRFAVAGYQSDDIHRHYSDY